LTSLGIGEAVVTVLSEKGAPTQVAWTRMRVPRSLMASIGTDAISAAAKSGSLQAKYGQTIEQPPEPEAVQPQEEQPQEAPPSQEAPPPRGQYDPLPYPDPYDIPPMPAPAEPKGPGMLEQVLNNPTVKSGINTAIREAVKGIFGTGRGRRK
jgi:uncharacterized protein